MSEEDRRFSEHVARWLQTSPGRPANAAIPGPGQESVWDYPRPPRLEPVADRLRVELDGDIIAETSRGLRLLETASPPTYYFPPQDVNLDQLARNPRRSLCEWKGEASYWTLRGQVPSLREVAWTYETPSPAYAALAGFFAFYAGEFDACYVGEDKVLPQAGSFYGGWATWRIVGPYKGEPGTGHW